MKTIQNAYAEWSDGNQRRALQAMRINASEEAANAFARFLQGVGWKEVNVSVRQTTFIFGREIPSSLINDGGWIISGFPPEK